MWASLGNQPFEAHVKAVIYYPTNGKGPGPMLLLLERDFTQACLLPNYIYIGKVKTKHAPMRRTESTLGVQS